MTTISLSDIAKGMYEKFRDQFGDRMQEKGVSNASCPICGHDTWEVLGGTTADAFSMWGDKSPVPRSLETIPIGCEHCGFIAHFATALYDLGKSS